LKFVGEEMTNYFPVRAFRRDGRVVQ
jgi:hypothetical protein